jgi:hypothetical protein
MAILEGAPDMERLLKVLDKLEQVAQNLKQNALQIIVRSGAKLNFVQEQMLRLE